MKRLLAACSILSLSLSLALAMPVAAQAPAGFDGFLAIFKAHPPQPVAAPVITAIPLSTTGSPDTTQWESMEGWVTARNVTQPALYPILPAPGTANGTAVIIAPGGAFLTLAFDTEGREVAKYLAARGITCFVLTYRVDETPKDTDGLAATIGARMGSAKPNMTHGDIEAPAEKLGQEDGLAAMAYVRSHASDYGIDPHKIGFMGFSAGGMTTMNVATHYDAATRPDFIGVIYGAMYETPVPVDAPPAFIALAADDPLLGHASVPIFDAWRDGGHSAELHIYAHGSHGFGMRKVGTSADHWIEDYYSWLTAEKLVVSKP
jgi:acetyl esterase/lipase